MKNPLKYAKFGNVGLIDRLHTYLRPLFYMSWDHTTIEKDLNSFYSLKTEKNVYTLALKYSKTTTLTFFYFISNEHVLYSIINNYNHKEPNNGLTKFSKELTMNLIRLYIQSKLLPIKANEEGKTKLNINLIFVLFCLFAVTLSVYSLLDLLTFYGVDSWDSIGLIQILRITYFVLVTTGGINYLALMSMAGID